jgi:hypothetical protein
MQQHLFTFLAFFTESSPQPRRNFPRTRIPRCPLRRLGPFGPFLPHAPNPDASNPEPGTQSSLLSTNIPCKLRQFTPCCPVHFLKPLLSNDLRKITPARKGRLRSKTVKNGPEKGRKPPKNVQNGVQLVTILHMEDHPSLHIIGILRNV